MSHFLINQVCYEFLFPLLKSVLFLFYLSSIDIETLKLSNPDTKDQQNTLKKNDEKSLRFISGHSTLEHDDIEYEYYETDSSEKELNDNKRQNVVLGMFKDISP